MIKYFTLNEGLLEAAPPEGEHPSKMLWVDLISPTDQEKKQVEGRFDIELFTQQESEEIESSSRYYESEKEIGINLNFLRLEGRKYVNEPVSFIIKDRLLVTQRAQDYRTFSETYKKLNNLQPEGGDDIFVIILETRIDYDADLIEKMTEDINAISKELLGNKQLNQDLLLKITALQESTITIRENIVEKQRILSAILKSKFFPREDYYMLRVMISDVNSLLEHSRFNFERLEFLQNTFLGLLDLEQNRVIKIFTVVTVIFMPPTLIASIYGMNFDFMPELDKLWGYPFAIVLMVISSLVTLLFFKRKKWL